MLLYNIENKGIFTSNQLSFAEYFIATDCRAFEKLSIVKLMD